MERVNRILAHPLYQECLNCIRECEKDRIFCHHDMTHFLDVARLAYIINLTEDMKVSKERIYSTALLHDIGRHIQYIEGTPHEIASAKIAPEILNGCGYDEEEIEVIVEAIANHRNKKIKEDRNLNGLIYRADKMSRSCFACVAEKECNWSYEKKNMSVIL